MENLLTQNSSLLGQDAASKAVSSIFDDPALLLVSLVVSTISVIFFKMWRNNTESTYIQASVVMMIASFVVEDSVLLAGIGIFGTFYPYLVKKYL